MPCMEHASQRPMSIQLICTLHFLAFIVPTTISSEFRLQGCATYALFEVLDLVTFMWSYIAVGLYSIHATVQPMMSATASVRPVELMKVNLLSWVAADAADNSTVLPKLATYPQCASVLASFAVTLSSFKRMLLSGTASTVAGLGLHCPFAAAKEASRCRAATAAAGAGGTAAQEAAIMECYCTAVILTHACAALGTAVAGRCGMEQGASGCAHACVPCQLWW